jgi:hypothetical protein
MNYFPSFLTLFLDLLCFFLSQILDILLSVSSISSILMLYAPISRYAHAAISMLCIGLLVAPVSNDPTSPGNIVFALLFAVCGLVVSIVVRRYFPGSADQPLRREVGPSCCASPNLITFFFDASSGAVAAATAGGSTSYPSYALVAGADNDDDAVNPSREHGHEARMGRNNGSDIEMTGAPFSGSASRSEVDGKMQNSGTDEASNEQSFDGAVGFPSSPFDTVRPDNAVDVMSTTSFKGGIRRCAPHWRLPYTGLLVGILGLTCFVLQSGDYYYVYHSLWHVFMMISAYLLVRGRIELPRDAL